jgi:integrase
MAKRSNIRRRGKAWVVHARINGQQTWRSFKTRDEAELHLSRILEQRSRGETPQRRVRATFAEVAAAWYRDGCADRNWKASTRRDYRSALHAHLGVTLDPMTGEVIASASPFGSAQLHTISAEQIASWRSGAMARGLPRRTAEKLLAILHGIFEYARRPYGLYLNPATEVEHIAVNYSGDLDFYSPEEVWALVRAASSEQDAAIFLTAAFTGLRRGELVALRVRDVDFSKRKMYVSRSYALGELSTPKSGKVRSVPMAQHVAQALAALLEKRTDLDPDQLMFPGSDGGYLDASALRRRYVEAQTGAGLRLLRFHDLRHVFGSTVINTAPILKVQAWMGHADIKTTMRYLHHKAMDGDAELVDDAFAGETLAVPLAEAPETAAA